MEISNQTILWAAAALVLGIATHQYVLHQRAEDALAPQGQEVASPDVSDIAPTATETAEEPEGLAAPALDSDVSEPPSVVIDPFDSLAVKERMLDEQVRRMENYAMDTGPDDPFALSPESIAEFKKRGDPVIW